MNRRQIITGAVSVAGASVLGLGLGTALSAALEAQEDAILIKRVKAAPERQIYYVEVGDISADRLKAHLNTLMNNYTGARV